MSEQFRLGHRELRRTYSTKGYAKAALKKAKRRGSVDGRPRPASIYWCERCNGYHLTTIPRPKDMITSQRARQVI